MKLPVGFFLEDFSDHARTRKEAEPEFVTELLGPPRV
jgi:hypothetical protein